MLVIKTNKKIIRNIHSILETNKSKMELGLELTYEIFEVEKS